MADRTMGFGGGGGEEPQAEMPASRSRWPRTLRNPSFVVGGTVILMILTLAIFAPLIAPFEPAKLGVGRRLLEPGWEYLLGTDQYGRDIFSRIIYGSRLILYVGLVAVGFGLGAGIAVGVIAGYTGGWVRGVLMRSVDFLYTFPDILIALMLVAILGPSLTNSMIAVGISLIPYYARVTYGIVLAERQKVYIEAAISIGIGRWRVIFMHLLPNITPPIVVVATLGFSTAVLSAAALSFLGLGAQPPSPEWGAMLAEGRNYITRSPWLLYVPGIAIAVTVLAFNIFGDGIRDVVDRRQRREGG